MKVFYQIAFETICGYHLTRRWYSCQFEIIEEFDCPFDCGMQELVKERQEIGRIKTIVNTSFSTPQPHGHNE